MISEGSLQLHISMSGASCNVNHGGPNLKFQDIPISSTVLLLIVVIFKCMFLHLPVWTWSVFYRGCGKDSAAEAAGGRCERQNEAFLLRLHLLLRVYSCPWSSPEKKAEELHLIYKLAVNFWWQSNKNVYLFVCFSYAISRPLAIQAS